MTPSKFMLYLPAGKLSAALELLRRIAQPESRSLPHITVRYGKRSVSRETFELYEKAVIGDLILANVTTFDPDANSEELSTVIIKCGSEDLEWLSHKPDYPDSVFHLTLYDGPPSTLAAQMLNTLRRYPWNLYIDGFMPVQPYDRSRGRLSDPSARLTPAAQELFDVLAARVGIEQDLINLTDTQRLLLVDAVSAFVHALPEVAALDEVEVHVDDAIEPRYSDPRAFWTSSELQTLAPGAHRLRAGSVYVTPPELAIDIAKATIKLIDNGSPIDFGEPAVGPGIFFAALRRVFDGMIGSATGIEIDPGRAAETAWRWRGTNLRVVQADFLTRRPTSPSWSLLLANPPYMRHQEQARELASIRSHLSQELDLNLDGRSDMYVYFVLSAQAWLARGAIASWLLPAEFGVTDFGGALRAYLTRNVTPLRIHFYDPQSPRFENARVTSTLVVYRVAQPAATDVLEVSWGSDAAAPARSVKITVKELASRSKWNWLTLSTEAPRVTRTIGDYFNVRRGIATGANKYFVLDDAKMAELDVPRKYVKPLLPRARLLESRVVRSLPDGSPDVSGRRWVIDTKAPLPEIRAVAPKFAAYLNEVIEDVGQRTQVRARSPIYKQEEREPAAFAFVYMAQVEASGEQRFIRNESDAVVLNNYLSLTPKPSLLKNLVIDRTLLEEIHRRLGAISPDELGRAGRLYASGLLKLEPREVSSLPLNLEDLVR